MVRFSLAGSVKGRGPTLLVAGLLLGSCSGSAQEDGAAQETTTPTTEAAMATTTATIAPTTLAPQTAPAVTVPAETAPTTVPLHGDGSGCVVDGTTLPDGHWYGFINVADPAGLSFDLACWFSFEEANRAAAEDGEESPVPNDYYVRNNNPLLRTVPVDGSAQVVWLASPGSPEEATVDYPFWLANRGSRSFQPGVWIDVVGGAVTFISEQYTP